MQMVSHISSKLRNQSKASCQSYKGQMKSGLQLLLKGLRLELDKEKGVVNTSINEYIKECGRLEAFQVESKNLK